MALAGGNPVANGQRVRSGFLVPALAFLLAAPAGLLALARPGADWLVLCALAVLPLGAGIFGGLVRAATVTAALGYVAVLISAYTSHISPVYAYAGLIDGAPDATELLVVTGLAALPAAWIPLQARTASTVVLWVVYLMGYLPAIVVPAFLDVDLKTALPLDLALLASMAIIVLLARLPPARITGRPLSWRAFSGVLLALTILTSLYILASFGLHGLPSLADVYGTRAEFKLALGGVVGGGYVIHWASGVINPLLFALGIARRRASHVILAVTGQLLIYSVTGYKATLFSIGLVPLVYLAIVIARRSYGLLMTLAVPTILFLAVSAGTATNGLASRMYATPAQLTWYYYEYFSTHPKYELSHSFLSWLTTSSYTLEPSYNIGSVYFPGKGTNANAGIWADAFANFGFVGIFVFSLVFGVVLWLANALARGRDARIVGPTLAVVGLAVNSGALFTAILTEGIVLFFLLMWLMPPASAEATAASPPLRLGVDRPGPVAEPQLTAPT